MSARLVHNAVVVISKIRSFGGGFEQYMQSLLADAMNDDIMPKWLEHVTLADHSLRELAELGHPYSTRYPKDAGPHPDYDVHEQSGELVASTTIQTGPNEIRLINTSAHYEYIRYGTRYMRPRDPGGEAMIEALPAIKQRFAEGVRGATIQWFTK